MLKDELIRDLKLSIERLQAVLKHADAIWACDDDTKFNRVRKAVGAVSELADWTEKQLLPEEVPTRETLPEESPPEKKKPEKKR